LTADVTHVLKIASQPLLKKYAILAATERGYSVYQSEEGKQYYQVGDQIASTFLSFFKIF
jgi:hypothetical protein